MSGRSTMLMQLNLDLLALSGEYSRIIEGQTEGAE
jgi:hypothetical protein